MSRVGLIFDPDISALIGRQYGRECFETMIEPFIKDDEELIVVFPIQITNIAMSFMEEAIVPIYDRVKKSNVKIIGNEKVVRKILQY